MLPHRDDTDDIAALARTTDLLLEAREPARLGHRFLAHVADLFHADAGLFQVSRGDQVQNLSLRGIDDGEARRLAVELGRALEASGVGARAWRTEVDAEVPTAWPNVLAATSAAVDGERRAVLALFASHPGGFGDERDVRLVGLMVRHAVVAYDHAALHAQTQRQADRLAVQADELERMHRALELHSQEIERSLAVRSRFFTAVSHELRTPINAIVGYSELLHQGVFGDLVGRQHEVAAKIEASAHQLLSLVNEILDFSKIEAGKMQIRRDAIDLHALVAEAVAGVEIAARHKGLEVRIDCPEALPRIESDSARVRQILLNLLSNAVKFTESGSVSLQVRHFRPDEAPPFPAAPECTAGPEGWVGIAVHDTGVGIPHEQIRAIFDEFVQLSHPAAGMRGTGLGLAISSRLAQLLGGQLTVDSEVGARSTFMLFLPCPAPVLEAAAADA